MSKNIVEIKREPRNTDTLQIMNEVMDIVKDNEDATEVFMLVKMGGDYHRFSSGITDLMKLVATLELAKFDCLRRMSD